MELLVFFGVCYVLYKLFGSSAPKPKPVNKSNSRSQKVVTKSNSSRHFDDEEGEDELVTFTISYGHEEEKSKNKTPGKWISGNESINVKGVQLRGNFYYGGTLKALDNERSYFSNQETEASLVDDSLKITPADFSYTDQSLAYWPKFISLSPKARGAYLNWLASDRNHPDAPIGYVFIYFYGIERRVIHDANNKQVLDSEYLGLFEEVSRLKVVYGESRSFFNYATRLIEFMCLQRPDVCKIDAESFSFANDSLLFKFELSTVVASGQSISPQLALSWIKFYPEYRFRTPARRCAKEFAALFKTRYAEKYGNGFVVKPNKTKLNISYWPASSTLSNVQINQDDLPDPSMLKGPTNKLIAIADVCTEELEQYSRYLGKKDTSSNDIAALLLLPEQLISSCSSSALASFKTWANDAIQHNSGLVSLSDFWKMTGESLPEKLNKKEMGLIQNLASKSGFGFAPDPRYHHAKPTLDGNLVLFSEGHGDYFEPSKSFNEVAMALRLGAMVATIDSHVDEHELTVLHRLIEHDPKLSPTEKKSLKAYVTWRLNTPANMNGLKARLEKLDEKAKSLVSHILVTVALADGKIDPTEIKQLEKLYAALGLDKSLVTSDIHNISSRKSLVSTQNESTQSHVESFALDEELLALHESETSDVQSMLSAIFVEDDPIVEENSVVEPVQAKSKTGLDNKHENLYQELATKDVWARNDVIELCRKLELMLDGAIETINDWSYEAVEAPVLDDDDDIYVDLEIVEELKG